MSAKFQPVILTATTPSGNHIQYEFFKGIPGKEEIVEKETFDKNSTSQQQPQQRQPASRATTATEETQNCIWKFFNKTTNSDKNENNNDDAEKNTTTASSSTPSTMATKQYELFRLTFKYLPAAWGQQTEVSIELPHPASPSMFTKSIKYSKSVFRGMRQNKVNEKIDGVEDGKEISASLARMLKFFEFGNNSNDNVAKESVHDDNDEENICVIKKFFESILFPAFGSHSDVFLYHVNNSEIFVSLLSGKLQSDIEARRNAAAENFRPIPIAEEEEECLK